MNIEKFIKEDLEIGVKINEKGDLELNLDGVVKGLGFTEIAKSGNISVKWTRVTKYLAELNIIDTSIDTSGGNNLPQYIPEWVFYMLCMKAKNEKARKFQLWISKEVLPSLRKNNFYINNENITPEQVSDLENEIKKLKIEKGILHEIVYDISDATTMSFTEVSKKIFNKDAKYLKNILIEYKFLAEDGYTPLLKEADFKLPNGGVQKMRIFTTTNVEKCRKNEDIRYNKITNFGYMFIKKYFNKLGLTNFNFNKEDK